MFRFAVILSLCLLIAFTGIGLLVSREWGWPEYASDELYVVYYWGTENPLFLVKADGSGEQWNLRWNETAIRSLDCSPDGRTLAFMTDEGHLYVLASGGILYDKRIDQVNSGYSVSNNGAVALFSLGRGEILLDEDRVEPLILPPTNGDYYSTKISSKGFQLWNSKSDGIRVFSHDGTLISSLPRTDYGQWLADEQIFIFDRYSSILSDFSLVNERYLMDTTTETIAHPRTDWGYPYSISPDGTMVATLGATDKYIFGQIILKDAFSNRLIHQLTYNQKLQPLTKCFLTFRPQMLLADNPQ